MAQKRKVQEAFGGQKNQLSAFAAAKLARQSAQSAPSAPSPPPRTGTPPEEDRADVTAIEVAEEPYDGHHSARTSPSPISVDDEDVIAEPSLPKLQPITLSTFVPRADNVIEDDESCLKIALSENETATFIGEYEIRVISGTITIYGSVLRPNFPSVRVYASSVAVVPQIQARQQSTAVQVSTIKSGMRRLGKLSPLFRNIWHGNKESERSFELLTTSDDDILRRALHHLEIDRDMELALRTLSAKSVAEREQPRILTIGGKSTGKSTFNRVLCNHLNSWTPGKKCYYLDLDPGQPEFGPPGQLSLVLVSAPILGPPFTHPAASHSSGFRLIRSHTIAAMTFKDDPAHYKACAWDLISHVGTEYPLVINACGWTHGLGGSVLLDLLPDLRISDAVLLEPLDTDLVQSLQFTHNDATFHRISRRAPKPWTRSPAETRTMQTMAYFHTRLSGNIDVLKVSGKPLSHMRPWNVSYADSGAGIAAVMSYNQSPNPDFLVETLDGSVVAVVVIDQNEHAMRSRASKDTELRDILGNVSRTPEGIPFVELDADGFRQTLDPSSGHTVGLALVRGVDVASKTLQLIIPLSENQIEEFARKTVLLVRGRFDAPGWAYLEDVYKSELTDNSVSEGNGRPWISQGSQVGIEGSVWRLRHPPLVNSQTIRA